MTVNLPTNIESMSDRELMVATGQLQEGEGQALLPVLRVNYDDADSQDREIPRGQWSITTEDGTRVFSKSVLFRPMLSLLQYSHYDSDKNKVVSKSIFFKSWSEEVPDTAGGFKCGKLTKKQQEDLTPAELEYQRKIKLSRVLIGFVTMDGKDAEGNDVSVKDYPAMFYARGTNYMPVDGFIKDLGHKKKLMQTVVMEMSLERKKNDGVTYWEAVPKLHDEITVDTESLKALQDFSVLVRTENEAVIEDWRRKREKKSKTGDEAKLVEDVEYKNTGDVVDDLNDDFKGTVLDAG